jgi:hypothetical protein
MLRVTVALSVFSLLVGWLQILVAHRRRERLLLQSMYSQWLAAHPHAAPLQPRCVLSPHPHPHLLSRGVQ